MVIPILKMKLPQCNAIGVPTPPNNQPQNSLHQIALNIIQKNHVSHCQFMNLLTSISIIKPFLHISVNRML